MHSSMPKTNTLPSPIFPVLAASTMALTAFRTRLSEITISNFTFERKPTVYSLLDKFLDDPLQPKAFDFAYRYPSNSELC